MMDVLSLFSSVLGIDAEELSAHHLLARCFVIYVVGVALVRLGNKRFIGKMSAFDTVVAIIIGSLLSRAITQAGMFLEILASCLLLILLHRLFSTLGAYSERFGSLIKGNDRVIVRDGDILWDAMRSSSLSEQDLMQSLRLNAQVADVSEVKIARLERNGDISVIMKDQ